MPNKNQIKIANGLKPLMPVQEEKFTLEDFEGNQGMYDAYIKISKVAVNMDDHKVANLAEKKTYKN